jgi:hypothetical protein
MSGTTSINTSLLSPGVSVQIIPEVYYGSGAPSTIPLIVFATQTNKPSPTTSGTIAPYTAPQNAGVLYYATSQRELIQNYGYPLFTQSGGTIIQGDELSEYGLHCAYSYLGISNAAFVLRADLDLGSLVPSITPPVGAPTNGTYWLNLSSTGWGLFISNGASSPGSAWTSVPVLVPAFTQTAAVVETVGGVDGVTFLQPSASFGSVGNYAVVPWDVNNFIYQKFLINGTATWVRIGSTYLTGMNSTEASMTWAAQFPNVVTAVNPVGTIVSGYTFSINGAVITTSGQDGGSLAGLASDITSAMSSANIPYITAAVVNGKLVITNAYGTGLTFADGNGTTTGTPGGQTIGALEAFGITAFFASFQSVSGSMNATSINGSANPTNISSLNGMAMLINGYEVSFTAPSTLLDVITQINTQLANAPSLNNLNTYYNGAPDIVNGIPTNLITGIVATVNNFGAILLTNHYSGSTIPGIIVSNISNGTALSILGLPAGVLKSNKVVRNSNATYPANSLSGDLWIKGNPANSGAAWVVQYYNATTGAWSTMTAPFFQFNSKLQDGNANKDAAAVAYFTANGATPSVGTVYIGYDPVADQLGNNGGISAGGVQQIRIFTGTNFAQAGEINPPYSGYQALEYEADFIAPTTTPAPGVLWYNNNPSADIMVSDGTQWLGYGVYYPNTDSNGPIISGSAPTQQVGGHPAKNPTSYALVDNDIWIDTSDTENYPLIYKYVSNTLSWTLIDNTDHTTPFGIVFGDARQDSGVAYSGQPLVNGTTSAYTYGSTLPQDMTLSSFVDPDANNAETIAPYLYPDGMMLFNTRLSSGNVKSYQPSYFNSGTETTIDAGTNYNTTDFTVTSYNAGTNDTVTFPPTSAARWVTVSGNSVDTNVPYMLRKAQRIMIVKALAEEINTNQDILSELIHFNLIAVPGYPELMPDMRSLNVEQKQVSLCVSDTPIRLASDSASLAAWAQNVSVPAPGEDGLGTFTDDYTAIYYPWGLGQNYDGSEVMIPPSTIALRVMAYNDQVSFPWFAPAGFTRGLVTNATSVGYLTTASGEGAVYQPVILNQGQRDTLYTNNINPIAYIPTRGLVVFGQKTLSGDGTILNRVNIVRLVNYIAYNLDIITKPYLFEQNDNITQIAAGNTVSRFLNGLVGQRALYDYAVLCDSTNNTPDRVDLNQLWIDVLIQPLNAVEFIYIPVRVVAQGDSNILNVS